MTDHLQTAEKNRACEKKKISREIELVDLFCECLDSQGYEYKREVRKRSYHNEGYVDVVVKDGGYLIPIEAKMNNFLKVVNQAISNLLLFKLSYVLYPRMPKKLHRLKDFGIGLIVLDGNAFKIAIKPKLFCFPCFEIYSYKKYTLWNWRENRAGRFMWREVPEDYPQEKLEALKPTYDWTRMKKKSKKKDISMLNKKITDYV